MMRRSAVSGAFCFLLAVGGVTPAQARDSEDDWSLDELMAKEVAGFEVVGVSRFLQRASEAPSDVTVLTAGAIRAYGWRTLGEALNSVRGFLTTNGHDYTYGAIRGFSSSGDYNSRILLMIDGMRTNGNVYDQALLGQEFPLDLDLIERVEIARGPGSMVYGGNALFATINVITKAGKDIDGIEAAASTGSFATRKGRLSYGKQLDNGADVLVSATGFGSTGQSLYFPELGQASRDTDDESAKHLFGRYRLGDVQLSLLWGKREHGRPSGAYGSVFNDPRNRDWDGTLLLDARYQTQLTKTTRFNGQLFFGQVKWRGNYVEDNSGTGLPPFDVDAEHATGRWAGGNLQLHYSGWTDHQWLFGLDYQNNLRQDQFAAEAPPSPLLCVATGSTSNACVDDRRSSYRLGAYVQDDVRLTNDLRLNLGLRHDSSDLADSQWSPRLGLIWRANMRNVAKLLYSRAFRFPNAYELYYSYPGVGTSLANPDLKAETIQTYELLWQHYLGDDMTLTGNLSFYQLNNGISQVYVGDAIQFQNQPTIRGHGIELELEKSFRNGGELRLSYALHSVPEHPNELLNAPSLRQLKANFSTPLPWANWSLGTEARYASGQATYSGHTRSYALANLNLRWHPQGSKKTEVSLGIYNLFDKDYLHSFYDGSLISGIPRESIAQDGRTWQLKMIQRF